MARNLKEENAYLKREHLRLTEKISQVLVEKLTLRAQLLTAEERCRELERQINLTT
jgi:hypothetical protein